MRITLTAPIALLLPLAVFAQTPERKLEFEAVSVKAAPPAAGFQSWMGGDSGSGGPGTADPGMFRCANCKLEALINKAFQLQNYQFPGRASLPGGSFDVSAKVPANATPDEFQAMLQNLLKERFGLVSHFEERPMRGYHLAVAKGGSKLIESKEASPVEDGAHRQASAGAHGWGQGDTHSHSGPITFNGQSRYQGRGRTIAELVRMLSDQLGRPVDDQTGLTGKYDISLTWAGENTGNAHVHADGPTDGEHGGHSETGAPSGGTDAPPLGLAEALQSQLGLKLVQGDRSVARVFVVDHIEKTPASN